MEVLAKAHHIRPTAFLQGTAITVDDGQNAGSSEPGVTGDSVVIVEQPPVQQRSRSAGSEADILRLLDNKPDYV